MPLTVEQEQQITQVRALIADTDPQNRILDEEAVLGFLGLNPGSVRLAAADALESMAASEALVSKKIRTQDLATDGPAVAAELRALAASLRRRARELGEDPAAAGEDFFDVVDTLPGRTFPEHTNTLVTGL